MISPAALVLVALLQVTATPTPTPTYNPVPLATIPAIPSPTLIPTATAMPTMESNLPHSEIHNYLSTAVANVNVMPEQIEQAGGVGVVPSDDARQMFSYIKWLFSSTSTQEVLGRNFSPVALNMFFFLVITIVFTGLFFTVKLAVMIVKGIIWLVHLVTGFFFGR